MSRFKVENKNIVPKKIVVKKANALFLELESFVNSIKCSVSAQVTGLDGLNALCIAKEIKKIIENKQNR